MDAGGCYLIMAKGWTCPLLRFRHFMVGICGNLSPKYSSVEHSGSQEMKLPLKLPRPMFATSHVENGLLCMEH